eukprot:3635242-Ditylum_brightwellii.AAC.1
MSPSGQHLCHLKALRSQGPDNPASDEGKELRTRQDNLIQAQVVMINYALKHKYSYNRWKNIVNVILLKEADNNKIHKIRVIHIYEADYSAMTVIIWRGLIKSSKKQKTINKGQLGGGAGHDTITLTFLEEIKKDIIRYSRKPLVNFDNDAALCCNRIIPNLAN